MTAVGWALCPVRCAGLCCVQLLVSEAWMRLIHEVLAGSYKEGVSALTHVQGNGERLQKFVLCRSSPTEREGRKWD